MLKNNFEKGKKIYALFFTVHSCTFYLIIYCSKIWVGHLDREFGFQNCDFITKRVYKLFDII